ncbi:MAG TPA: glycosyltransferase family 4 protein [Candidatus Krumholzibacteria bacterium]|nr:glycosyltransferase family 4 protein [Candidatus Krumholzibacteria bacterium]
MNVCVVSLNLAAYFDTTPRSKYGGAEVQAAFVARALRDQGVNVSLVVADLPADVRVPYPVGSAFRSDDGLPLLRFFHPRMTGISDALARANADIYYQRNAGMLTGLVAHHARKHGRRFVFGAGSDTDFSFRDVLIDGFRDKTMFMYGLRRAHGVVTQNQAQLEAAQRALKAPVVTIPNGVLPVEQPSARVDGPVLWAGGLRDVKRPDLFVELARRFPQREFVIVGGPTTTSGAYAAEIQEEARNVSNLRLTGWLPNSDVIREIAKAAVIVNTSSFEGFPNVYLEAWNYGVPVVSFNDVDGLLANEKLGALCSDLDDMEKKLRTLLDNPEEMRAAGERARRVISSRFSPAVLGPQYVRFFESLA